MIPEKVSKLLRKKNPTGADLGLLLVMNYVNDKKIEEGRARKPLLKEGKMSLLYSRLTSEKDIADFAFYSNLLNGIVCSYNNTVSLIQRFYHGFYRVLLDLKEIENSTNLLLAIHLQPLDMTPQQYDEGKAKAVSDYRNRTQTFEDVFFHIMGHGIRKVMESLSVPADEVCRILDKYRFLPALPECKLINSYDAAFECGYFVLPDGTRSDKVDPDHWDKACRDFLLTKLTEEQIEKASRDRYELFFMGADYARSYFEKLTGKKPSLTAKDLLVSLDAEPEKKGDIMEVFLSCYGITFQERRTICEELSLFEQARLYHRLHEKGKGTKTPYMLLLSVKKEMPELYSAIVSCMEEHLDELHGLEDEMRFGFSVTQGRLVDAGISSYKEEAALYAADLRNIYQEDTQANYLRRHQIVNGGVSVIQQPSRVGDIRDLSQSLMGLLARSYTLDKLGEDRKAMEQLRSFQAGHILGSYKRLLAYNALFDILEKVFDLPELGEAFKYNTSGIEKQMAAFNDILYKFYAFIFGTEKDKARQRAILKKAFMPLDTRSCAIRQQDIEAVEQEMRKDGTSPEAIAKLIYFEKHYLPILENGGAQ